MELLPLVICIKLRPNLTWRTFQYPPSDSSIVEHTPGAKSQPR